MADSSLSPPIQLTACRELLETHPDSLRIREQVEAVEDAMPDRPGVVVSFCMTIIETTCKTILTDRGVTVERGWEAEKLISEALRYVNLGPQENGKIAKRLRNGANQLVRGINQIIGGISSIRNDHGSAAHGADVYSPLLDARYAEILARATDAVVGILFKTHLRLAERNPPERFRYGEYTDFNDFIDNRFGPFEILEVQLTASEALFRTDHPAYREALIQFKQDQEAEATAADPEEAPA